MRTNKYFREYRKKNLKRLREIEREYRMRTPKKQCIKALAYCIKMIKEGEYDTANFKYWVGLAEKYRQLFERQEKQKKKTITINLLKGLTEEQIGVIKTITERFKDVQGFTPMAFTVDVPTGDVYYFNERIAFTKPKQEELK